MKKTIKYINATTIFLLILLFAGACGQRFITPTPAASPTPTSVPTASTAIQATETAVVIFATVTSPPAATTTSSATSPPAVNPSPTPTWPPAQDNAGIQTRPATTAEENALTQFEQMPGLARDDVQLARAYQGMTANPTPRPTVTAPLNAGIQQQLFILNIDNNTVSQITAELKAVGQHAYFWFDTGPGSLEPDPATLQETAATFDTIYEDAVALFGSESNPGIDGDSRVHVVNVSPLAVCAVTVATAGNCGLAGYFSAHDTLPLTANFQSNEREMFVMNVSHFGGQFYLSVLAHEFRHMIEENTDSGDRDWEVEGSAVLAETLLGYGSEAVPRANRFLSQPDQQLTNWADSNTLPHYGQGYLFNRYVYDRLGEASFQEFTAHPADGFQALDLIAQQRGDDSLRGIPLWLDWQTALALHDHPAAPPRYDLHDTTLNPVTMTAIEAGQEVAQTVHQFAADYYRIRGEGAVTIGFEGNNLVSAMGVMPASGNHMWTANRANFSDMQLSRAVDLTGVDEATLQYDVFHDIEYGYDFAYVSVSTDSGDTWQGLTAEYMQGDAESDDPSNSAFTTHFYTGESDGWQRESIDLTPFAGKNIHIRFEYITDPILTFAGIAIDNIAIPEIGFYDAAENGETGWQSNGFVRTTGYLPQRWYLQLITFPDGQPLVEAVELLNGQAMVQVDLAASGGEAVLVVNAGTQMTLELAEYKLSIR